MRVLKPAIVAMLFAVGPLGAATAQTVGSVFGPNVNADDAEAEYRIGFLPGDDGARDRIRHRLHYQQALSDRVRLRGIVQASDRETGDLELNFLQAELVWQTVEETPDGYSQGFRFDARLSEGDDGPSQLGANWMHQWSLRDGWRVRALLLFDMDVGDAARDGLFVETRTSLTRKLNNGLRVGVESFNDFGNTDTGFGDFDDQSHQLGPMVSGPLNAQWSWHAGLLIGLSEGADDTDMQLRLTRGF